MNVDLYHFWSDTASQQVRMALHFKKIAYNDVPLSYWDDETFFDLGVARSVPVLKIGHEQLHTNSRDILWKIDQYFPDSEPLVNGLIDEPAWKALLTWRDSVDAVLMRLLAPALLGYRDVAEDQNSVVQYKQMVQKKYGMSAEALANDRYLGYEQLAQLTRIAELSKHLALNQFYMGQMSIADILITADLFPLQCLDGVSLPIDFMYYLKRVETACNIDMQEGMLVGI